MKTIEELTEMAKRKYPIAIQFEGRFTKEEMTALEKHCTVHCFALYMDGSAIYDIRYKGENRNDLS